MSLVLRRQVTMWASVPSYRPIPVAMAALAHMSFSARATWCAHICTHTHTWTILTLHVALGGDQGYQAVPGLLQPGGPRDHVHAHTYLAEPYACHALMRLAEPPHLSWYTQVAVSSKGIFGTISLQGVVSTEVVSRLFL